MFALVTLIYDVKQTVKYVHHGILIQN